jgi:hypothetical protein
MPHVLSFSDMFIVDLMTGYEDTYIPFVYCFNILPCCYVTIVTLIFTETYL